MLRGDTVHFFTHLCSRQMWMMCELSTFADVASNWSVDGVAAVAEVGNAPAQTVAGAMRIVVRGLTVGSSEITAVSVADPLASQTGSVVVLDSSAITRIDMSTGNAYTDPLHLDGTRTVPARLRTASGVMVHGRPTSWSVSDSSVLRLAIGPQYAGYESRRVLPRKAGTAYVRTTFLGVTNGVQITVVP